MIMKHLFGKTETRKQEEDFDKLVQKMRTIETGMLNFRKYMQCIGKSLEAMSTLYTEFSTVFPQFYETSSSFGDICKDLSSAHQDISRILLGFNTCLNKLLSRTSEWNSLFTQIKNELKEREEKKKNYDHYEDKLDKLMEAFEKKKKIDQDKYDRNEEKFKKAANEYKESTESCAKKINDLLNRRYGLVNPIVIDFVIGELVCANELSANVLGFSEIEEDMSKRQDSSLITFDTKNYDPLKNKKMQNLAIRGLNVKSQSGIAGDDTGFVMANIHKFRSSFPAPDPFFLESFAKIKDDLDAKKN